VVAAPGSLSNGTPSVAANVAGGPPRGPITAMQVSQMFGAADLDHDGLLSRAEALRLPLVTMSFDDMDTNRDGVVSRSEYDASLR